MIKRRSKEGKKEDTTPFSRPGGCAELKINLGAALKFQNACIEMTIGGADNLVSR